MYFEEFTCTYFMNVYYKDAVVLILFAIKMTHIMIVVCQNLIILNYKANICNAFDPIKKFLNLFGYYYMPMH